MNKFLYIAGAGIVIALFVIFSLTLSNNTDAYLDRILDKKEIVLGMDVPYGSMEFIDEYGNYVGVDVDVAKEIAKGLGVELKIVRLPWENLFDKLDAGEIDFVLNAVTITEERKENFLFSKPYFDSGLVSVIKKENYATLNKDGLFDKKLGGEAEATGLDKAYELATNDSAVKEYFSVDINNEMNGQHITDLRDGVIDAFITDYVHAVSIVWDIPSLKILDKFLSKEQYGVVMNKNAVTLKERVDEILDEMKEDGRLHEIKEKWLGDYLIEFD